MNDRASPHEPRLLARIAAEDAPLVLLWALPGSGRRRVLASLAEQRGRRARALSAADVATPETLRDRLAAGRRAGVTDWVCEAWQPDSVSVLLGRATVSERILASVDRLPSATSLERGRVAVIGPREWLLDRREVEACAGAGSLSAADLDRVFAATGGWLRPTELTLASAGRFDRGAVLEDDAIRGFLLDRVLPSLSSEERRELERGGGDRTVIASRITALASDPRQPVELLRTLVQGGSAAAVAAPSADPRFQVSLLGPPEVSALASGIPLRWPYRRVVALLALLLLEPDRAVSQARVVEALWPDREIDRARANLDPAISHLRRWLSPGERTPPRESCVLLANGVYRLNPRWRFQVDVEEFERLAAAEATPPARRVEGLERARRLYRGPLLEGFRGSWMRERRRRLGARYRRLLRELGDLYAGLGRIAESEDSYRSLLAVEPLEEEVHVAIMRLYARQGREDLVRRQYEKLSALLARELGIHPMDETIREVQRLLGR